MAIIHKNPRAGYDLKWSDIFCSNSSCNLVSRKVCVHVMELHKPLQLNFQTRWEGKAKCKTNSQPAGVTPTVYTVIN